MEYPFRARRKNKNRENRHDAIENLIIHCRTLRDIVLIMSTLLAFLAFGDFPESMALFGMRVVVAAGLLAVNWKHMRRLSDAADQAGTH